VRSGAALVLGLALAGGCASGPRFHEGPTALAYAERPTLLRVPPKQDGSGFRRFWRQPDVRIGLVKWADDRSSCVWAALADLVQAVRDELGKLNQLARPGDDVFVTVTVFRWDRGFIRHFSDVGYEVVGRDSSGRLLWTADDEIRVSPADRRSLFEGDEATVARALARKLRTELQL
jgi:hypothetical protein